MEIIHAWDVEQAIEALNKGTFDLVHLDHDLEDYITGPYGERFERTGLDVAQFLANMDPEKHPVVSVVHSWNPPGAKAMLDVLRAAHLNVTYAPFSDGSAQDETAKASCIEEMKVLDGKAKTA
jgi:hypothetical protein